MSRNGKRDREKMLIRIKRVKVKFKHNFLRDQLFSRLSESFGCSFFPFIISEIWNHHLIPCWLSSSSSTRVLATFFMLFRVILCFFFFHLRHPDYHHSWELPLLHNSPQMYQKWCNGMKRRTSTFSSIIILLLMMTLIPSSHLLFRLYHPQIYGQKSDDMVRINCCCWFLADGGGCREDKRAKGWWWSMNSQHEMRLIFYSPWSSLYLADPSRLISHFVLGSGRKMLSSFPYRVVSVFIWVCRS